MVTIDPSYGYTDNYGYTDATTTTTGGELIKTTYPTTVITSNSYGTITLSKDNWNEITISAPLDIEREKVIKNISVLKCKCCDAKLNIKKMKDNVIRCEYCDSDNYINIISEVY